MVFDDGNDKYKDYINIWKILKKFNGKCTLANQKDNVIINSISEWKILEIK